MSVLVTYYPSAIQCEESGVDHVTRKDGVHTVYMQDGTKLTARLANANEASVMDIIAAVKSENLTKTPAAAQFCLF